MNDSRIELLKNAPVQKSVNKLAAPAIVGMIVMSIYNIVDTMFVAWLGTAATGATQVVLPIVMLASAVGLTFGIGGGSYLSRVLGRNDMKHADEIASVTFFTGLFFGILFTFLNIVFMEQILSFFGANSEVMHMSKSYGLYIFIGSTPLIINMVLNNLLRSEGSSKLSMIGMASGALLNIILDPIFIFVFDWGIAGAAIATTLSQCVTTTILLSAYFRKKTLIHIKLSDFKLDKLIYREMFKVGLPTFFKQLLFSVSIGMLNQASVTYGGADLLAAAGIVSRTTMLPANVIFGLGQGFQPVAGYNLGAGKKNRVMDSFKYTIVFSTIIAAVTSILFIALSKEIFHAFKAQESVIYYGVKGLLYYSLGMLTLGFTNTVTVFYQAIGKGRESMFMSITRQGIFFIPAIILLPRLIGPSGVLMAQMVADAITAIAAFCMIVPFTQKDKIDDITVESCS